MTWLLNIFAVLFFIGFLGSLTIIRSDIQVIIAILLFGFALAFAGIAVAITEAANLRRRLDGLSKSAGSPTPTDEPAVKAPRNVPRTSRDSYAQP